MSAENASCNNNMLLYAWITSKSLWSFSYRYLANPLPYNNPYSTSPHKCQACTTEYILYNAYNNVGRCSSLLLRRFATNHQVHAIWILWISNTEDFGGQLFCTNCIKLLSKFTWVLFEKVKEELVHHYILARLVVTAQSSQDPRIHSDYYDWINLASIRLVY